MPYTDSLSRPRMGGVNRGWTWLLPLITITILFAGSDCKVPYTSCMEPAKIMVWRSADVLLYVNRASSGRFLMCDF